MRYGSRDATPDQLRAAITGVGGKPLDGDPTDPAYRTALSWQYHDLLHASSLTGKPASAPIIPDGCSLPL